MTLSAALSCDAFYLVYHSIGISLERVFVSNFIKPIIVCNLEFAENHIRILILHPNLEFYFWSLGLL